MNQPLIVAFLSLSILVMTNCAPPLSNTETEQTALSQHQVPITITHAKGFVIDTIVGGLQKITMLDITTGKPKNTIILVPKGATYIPKENESTITTPINRIGLFSASYIGYLQLLEDLDEIILVQNKNYIYNSFIQNRIENKNITEVGNTGQLNMEQLIISNPSVVLLSDMGTSLDPQFQKMKDAGIGIIACSEWQEQDPLARAEWIKLFGALTDKENLADSIFNEIEHNYNQIKNKCNAANKKPTALFAAMYNDVWYMPGGKSYVAQLLNDAHGTFAWADDKSTGSLPLSLESVALASLQNDVWISPQVSKVQELLNKDIRYKKFIDLLTLGIYEQNLKTNEFGGNDYWEMGVVRADWVLQDYAKMLHPELFENTNFTFFQAIE